MTMGYELVDRKGRELHINRGTSDLLMHLTAGWWPLLGLPDLIDDTDCKMMARVLENYATLQENMDPTFRKMMHWSMESHEDIMWMHDAAKFLKASGGVNRVG